MGMAEERGESIDVRIVRLARGQHRVVTRPALRAAGVSDGAIHTRVRTGRLHREHPGVYAVGGPVDTREGAVLAAVLAVGDGVEASHLVAAELLRLREPGQGAIHVTSDRPGRAPRGVVLHRTRHRDPDARVCRGVPCTGPARTIVDLAGAFGDGEAARAWRAAVARRMLRPSDVRAELALRRPGCTTVRGLLDEHLRHGTPRTVQELEERAADLLRPPRLPRAEFNAPLVAEGRRYRADVLWRHAGVIVELDSWMWHGTPQAHARDVARALDLQLAGWLVVHLTWADLTSGAMSTVERLGRLLASAAAGRVVVAATPVN